MADVNSNISINIDSSKALSQLKSLQRQIAQFHLSVAKSSEAAALAQRDLQRNLINSINSIGAFSAELRTVKTSAENFTTSLEKNKFSMREYFRYAGASTKTFGRLFKSEFDTIGRVAEERVKRLQTQYIKLGRDTTGAMKAIAVMPTELNLKDHSTQLQLTAQRQAIFNQLVKQGSTNLLNFGKNTQWAGRQLMVGFTIPITMLGTAAAKTFMDMETAAIKFKKVYGDLFTPAAETQQALDSIQQLGNAFTKYGIAVSDTVSLAAEAAAAGFQGLDLQRQTTEATRLQVLGQIDAQKALETTISLQNAFQMSSEDLAESINFLNAVENQTVVSLDDITTAIPKAAPVVKQLGGDVKDLAFFMAAMKEGGINASEGANALKSGLASLINPTDKAREMMQGFGIDIDSIVNKNAGNVKQTVIEFAMALDNLSDLNRQRAIEQLFGKFQLARLSTLFENVTKSGNQASRVLDLATASTGDLAAMAEKELGMTAESAMNKFRKAVEDLKVALVPLGKVFLETVTPILESLGGILDKFASLSEGSKKAIAILTIAVGGIAPVLLMTFGLLANFIANGIKFFALLRNGYLRLTGQSKILGAQTQYLTTEQLDAAAAAHSLNQSHANLTQTFSVETKALNQLIAAYRSAATAARNFAQTNPGMMAPIPGRRGGKKYSDGVSSVPGPRGAGDIVPAMLSPGEAVIPAKMVEKYAPLIQGMVAGNIPGFQKGLFPGYTNAVTLLSSAANQGLKGKSGYSASALAKEFSKGGAGIQAPIVRAMAEAMGATNANDVVKMIKNDPNLAKFGESISKGVAEELAKKTGKVTDPELSKIYNKVARTQAKKFGKTYQAATNKFLTQVTTFEDVTRTRVSQSTGRKRSIGRAAIFKNVGSYRGKEFGKIAGALGLSSIAGLVKAHMTPAQEINLMEMAKSGELTPTAIAAAERAGTVIPVEVKKEVKKQASKKKTTATRRPTTQSGKTVAPPKTTFRQRAGTVGRSLVGGRAGMAASAGLMAASFLPGKVGQVAGTAATAAFGIQAITQFAKILPIPHLKVFALGLTATVGIIKAVNAARERERVSIEGLSDAASITAEKTKLLGDFFGVAATETPFEKDLVTDVLTPQTRSQISLLRENKDFQKQYKTDIGVLRGATDQEASRVFQSLAIGLQGKGFAKEQINVLIAALREESGKTNVTLDFESLDLTTKQGRAGIKKSVDNLLKDYQKEFKSGFVEDLVAVALAPSPTRSGGAGTRGGAQGGISWVKQLVPSKELKKETKLMAEELKNVFTGLSGALQNGVITGDQFNNTFEKIQDSIMALNESNPAAALMIINGVISQMPKKFQKAVEGVDSLKGKMLLLRMQAVGLTSNLAGVAEALRLIANPNADVSDRVKAQLLVEKTMKQVAEAAKITEKELKKLFATESAGGGGGGKKFNLLKSLEDRIKATQNQTKALKAMEKAGIAASVATQLASDPETAAAIAALAEKPGKKWDEATEKIKAYAEALRMLRKFEEEQEEKEKTQVERMGESLDKLNAYYDLQEELIRLNYANELEKETKNLEDQQTVLDDINRSIESINRTIEQKTAPLTKILENNNYELERISFIEDKINEKYDKQEEALDRIASLQQDIANIQKGRLSIADALTRGDISAAASAIQELRATQSSEQISSQRDVIAVARKQEISALKRVDIEKENKLLQFEIATIQRNTDKARLDALELQKKTVESNIFLIEGNITSIESTIQSKIAAMATRFQAMFGITKTQIEGIVKALDLTEAAGIKGNKKTLDLVLGAASGNATALNHALEDAPALFDPILTKFGKLYDSIKSIFDYAEESTKPAKPKGVAGQEWVWENNKWVLKPLIKDKTSTPQQTTALTKTEEEIFKPSGQSSTSAPITFRDMPDIGFSSGASSAYTSAQKDIAESTKIFDDKMEKATSLLQDINSALQAAAKGTIIGKLEALNILAPEDKSVSLVGSKIVVEDYSSKSTITSSGGGGGGGGGMMLMMAKGGMVKPRYFANGAFARGTDTIPAMLSPGEFVVRKSAVDNIGVNALNRINDGASSGSGVYNYNLNVTLNGTDMDANDVANVVMSRIKQIDGQRIRRQVI